MMFKEISLCQCTAHVFSRQGNRIRCALVYPDVQKQIPPVLISLYPHPCVEQAVVYSTLPQEYSTLTFRGEVVAGGGGVEEKSEVMYCIEGRTYIYYRRA